MHLLTPCELSLQPVEQRPAGAPPVCEIVRNAAPTGAHVPGAQLEAAGEWMGFVLVLTTDDTPHEEGLHLHLFDASLQCLDSAWMGGAYVTGSFSLRPSPAADTLCFRFLGATDWSVQILPEPGFRLPLVSEPAGVVRPLGFLRHFIVRGVRQHAEERP